MYRPSIGLEIHAELATQTKMFCACANDPDEIRPNANVCPVCMAHPGALPVINREAVRQILRIGTAIGGNIADKSVFDRKSYFYPDIPKGYQISQYKSPLVTGGALSGVAITRVHLEEDTAKSMHDSDQNGAGKSLVDFNRAGVPLMELVTEPVITNAKDAGNFARELQLLLRTIGAGNANLEKGEMRIEANVSVRDTESATDELGTKVEVKNLNSFRAVERAIAYEINRQAELVARGGLVIQETRGWDDVRQKTFSQRVKEGSADYRYFPEPDLPPLMLSEMPEFAHDRIQESLPELPWNRRARYGETYSLKEEDVKYIVSSAERSAFFDAVASALDADTKLIALAANYIVSDLAGIYAQQGEEKYKTLNPSAFAKLIRLIADSSLSSRGAKEVLAVMATEDGEPEDIARTHNLMQVHDAHALGTIVDAVLAQEKQAVSEYREGKDSALQYLIGQAMRESKKAGNPAAIRDMLIAKLNTK